MKASRWITYFFIIPALLTTTVIGVNVIVDPYSMTNFNLLNIPNKFSRDDRVEKVAKLKTSGTYDTIMLGSSRVYSMNPLMVSKLIGGTTYNAGVGTARIEDHLGFVKLLERINKLPKNLIIGLDFYTFNEEVESTKYFIKNSDLNFISNDTFQKSYTSNFISIDAFRASYKTLRNFLVNKEKKPFFDAYGAGGVASTVFSFTPLPTQADSFPKSEIIEEYHYVKTLKYPKISQARIDYLYELIDIAKRNNIKLYIFITPLYGELLTMVEHDKKLYKKLITLRHLIQSKSDFYDFTQHDSIIDNAKYFGNPTHTTTQGGNLVLKRVLQHDTNMSINFGILRRQADFLLNQ